MKNDTGHTAPRITFISAGAGSGKTHRLTEILHDALVDGSARPSGIMATTFTKKSAAELEERVRRDLLSRDKPQLANAMGQALIGTINSVCGQLLERFSFELGLPRQLRVLDEPAAMAEVRKALDDAGAGGDDTLATLSALAARLGIEDWTKVTRKIMADARLNGIDASRLRTMGRENADAFLQHLPPASRRDLDVEVGQALAAAVPEAGRIASIKDAANAKAFAELLETWARRLPAHDVAWSEWAKLTTMLPPAPMRKLAEPVVDVVSQFMEHPRLHADIRQYLEAVFGIAADTLEIYALRKKEAGMIDYADQEQLLLEALANPAVEEVLRDELDLLLVDEFQDTSPIQLALFVRLAALAKRTYWVGDVKQAIYGFRGSDTELMKSLLDQLPALGGAKEVLNHSWRSCPGLVEAVNAVFVPAFSAILAPEDVALVAQRTEPLEQVVIQHWKLEGRKYSDRACAMAAGVRQLIEGGFQVTDKATGVRRLARFGDVAILAHSNERVKELAMHFSAAAIPVATAQPGLLARPESVLMLACLRRLIDPQDTVASAEIISLTECTEPEHWLTERIAHLARGEKPHTWRESGHGANPVLAAIAAQRIHMGLLSPVEALQMITTQAHLTVHALKWARDEAQARRRLANMDALLQLAAAYEEGCTASRSVGTVAGLLGWLDDLAARGEDAVANPGIDAVCMMTAHAAKGLEWPIVIVYDLDKEVRDNLWNPTAISATRIDAADPLADRFIRYWPWAFGQVENVPGIDCVTTTPVAAHCRAQATAEATRLLYVTMTRARDCMILATAEPAAPLPWLDCAQGAMLLAGAEGKLTLPSQKQIGFTALVCTAPEEAPTAVYLADDLHWFPRPRDIETRLGEGYNPSGAQPCRVRVTETCILGERLTMQGANDMGLLGTAVHAAIAANLAQRPGLLDVRDTEEIMHAHGFKHSLNCDLFHARIGQLRQWILSRWPAATIRNELLLEMRMPTGQILAGQIDLLIDTGTGWVIIDHKCNPEPASQWPRKADEYSGQLAAYATALKTITRRPVEGTWLHFVIGGGLVACEID